MATAEFSKFAGILSVALSQHHMYMYIICTAYVQHYMYSGTQSQTPQVPYEEGLAISNKAVSVFLPLRMFAIDLSQRKAMPKNARTTTQLHSSHTLVKWCSKFSKPEIGRASCRERVVLSAYLRFLIFLPAILIPACASSSPEFLMMYSAGLEKVSFHSNPKERQCQRMLKLPHNCTHLTR